MVASPSLGRALFESVADPVLLVEPAGVVVTDANPAAILALNRSRRQIVGSTLGSLPGFQPVNVFDDLQHVRHVLIPSQQDCQAFSVSVTLLTPEQAVVVLARNTSSATPDPGDATLRTTLGDNVPGLCEVDSSTGEILRASPHCNELLGLAPAEIEGRTWMDLTPPEDIPTDLVRLERLLAREPTGFTLEKRLHRAGNTPTRVRLTVWPGDSSEGKPTHIALVERLPEGNISQAELHFRAHAFRACNDGIVIVDATQPEQPIVYCNPAFERLTGYRTEEALGWNCRFLQNDDRDQPGRAVLRDAIENGTDTVAELRNYRRDGSMYWVEIRLSAIRDAAGRVTHFLAFQSDITERKVAEVELRTGREQLATQYAELALLYRTAPVGLCLVDTELRYVRINERLAAINGVLPGNHIGKRLRDVVPDVADQLEVVYRSVLETGAPATGIEVERFGPDGSKRSYLASYHPVHDEDDVIGVSAVVQEITAIRAAEAELRKRDRLVATSITPTVFGDREFRVTSANAAFLDLFGFPDEAAVTGEDYNLFELAFTNSTELLSALNQSGIWNGETRALRSDGVTIDVLLSVSVLRDAAGQPQSCVATFWDITDRKRAESALRLTKFSVDSQRAAIFWFRPDGRFWYVNDAACELAGYSNDELLTLSVPELDPNYPPEAWPEFWGMLRRERNVTLETAVRRKDGTVIPVEVAVSLMRYEGEEFAFAFVTDITERQESEANLQALIENTTDNILSIDQSYRVLTANSAVREHIKATWGAELQPGTNILEQLPPDVAAQWKQRYDRALAGERFVFEKQLDSPDGTFYFDVSFSPIESGGVVTGVTVYSRDVTDRRRNLAQREKHERLLEATNRVANVGGWELDLRTNELVWTAQTCRIHEVPEDYVPTVETAIRFYAPADRPRLREFLAESIERGTPWSMDAGLYTATGRRIWVRAQGDAEMQDGRAVRLYGAFQDITHIKGAEERLRERLAFEALVARISSAFITLPAAEVEDEIHAQLESLGRFLRLDRVTIGTLARDQLSLSATHGWCNDGIEPIVERFRHFDLSSIPWGADRLRRGLVTKTSCLADLPEEAAGLRMVLKSMGSQSCIMVPLIVCGEVWGLVHFDSVRQQRQWSDELVSQLRLVGEIFANALTRREADQAQRASEARFRLAFDQQFQFMVILSPEGQVLEINNLPIQLQGAGRDDYIGKLFWETPAWADLPDWQEMVKWRIREAISRTEPLLAEDMYRTADGDTRFVDAAYSVVRDEEGAVRYILVQASDITERRSAERALRHRLEFEALLSKISSEFINLSSHNIDDEIESGLALVGDFMGVDRAAITEFSADKTTLIRRQEWTAENVKPTGARGRILRVHDFPWMTDRWNSAQPITVASVRDLPAEASPERALLETLNVRSYVAVPLVVSGVVIGEVSFDCVQRTRSFSAETVSQIRLVGEIFANALSRKRTEEALRSGEERWKFAITGSGDGVWDWNALTREVFISDQLKEMLGYGADDFGTSITEWEERVHPEDRERFRTVLNDHLDGLTPHYESEHRLLCGDGNYKWVLDRGMVTTRIDGRAVRMIGTYSDISLRKESETLLEGEKRILEMIASGAPADAVLMDITLLVESQADVMCSILQMEPSGDEMTLAAAPSLPAAYRELSAVVPVGPEIGSCGTAAHLNCAVIVSDIATDPLWAGYKDFALQHGLRACWSVPLRSSAGQVLGTMAMYYSEPTVPPAEHEALVDRTAQVASIVLERQRSQNELKEHEELLRAMLLQLTAAEERERRRVSRILHDQLSPTLAVCQMRISALETSIDGADNKVLNEIWHRLEECSRQARSLAVETSPPVLYELGLVPAIEWLAERFEEQHGLRCVSVASVEIVELDESTLSPLFQSIRELLNNVARHARATRVEITTEQRDGFVRVCVSDNGIGFDPQDRSPDQVKARGFGLFGIRDRFDTLGGQVEIDAVPRRGTRVTLVAPIAATARVSDPEPR